ncbi:MAG TPA: hypothetical protein VHJ78_02885, partial [Actinomycetota bacterium]|nr:hypothetical protein [Actinomycetota bacterium]
MAAPGGEGRGGYRERGSGAPVARNDAGVAQSSQRPERPEPGTAASGKRFDPNRPRDTRVGGKQEPKKRLRAEESFDLPKPWVAEISELSRPGSAPRVARAVSEALELFAEEEYEQAAERASEAKENAPRSPR